MRSATYATAFGRELRRLLRQPLVLVALLLQVLSGAWLLRGQLDNYLALQAGGIRNLSVSNDLLTPVFGVLAAMLLLTAPLFAAAVRPALQTPYRRLSTASDARWLLPPVLAGLVLLLLGPLLLLLQLALLRLASAIAFWPLFSTFIGVLLLALLLLLLSLGLQLVLRQFAAALALAFLGMAAVAALELQTLLPTPLGFFRILRDGALPLGGMLSLLLATVLLLNALRLQRKQRSRGQQRQQWLLNSLLLIGVALAALWPLRWQPISVQTLTAAEQQVLQQLPADARLLIVSADPERQRDYLASLTVLTASNPALTLQALHPDQISAAERDALPGREGLLLSVAGQSAWLKLPSADLAKQSLAWLARLQRRNEQFLVFLEGHGERQLFGSQPRDLSQLRQHLDALGVRALPLQLQAGMTLPGNTAALVIASPDSALLPAEQAAIVEFVARGGNLLWLREPDEPNGFDGLASFLGVQRQPGTVLDLAGSQRGTPHPAIALVDQFPEHAALKSVRSLVALPWAADLQFMPVNGFQGQPLLRSSSEAVLVADPNQQSVPLDAPRGPFTLGWALQREHAERTQRIVVLGDGHFLADTAINNYGNRALALALLQWLAFGDDAIAAVDARAADADLLPSQGLLYWYRWGLPLLLPLLLLIAIGGYQWRWRRQ